MIYFSLQTRPHSANFCTSEDGMGMEPNLCGEDGSETGWG